MKDKKFKYLKKETESYQKMEKSPLLMYKWNKHMNMSKKQYRDSGQFPSKFQKKISQNFKEKFSASYGKEKNKTKQNTG